MPTLRRTLVQLAGALAVSERTPPPGAARSGLGRIRLAYALVTVAYVALRLDAFLPTSPRGFPDSSSYLHTAAAPFFSKAWFAGSRPFGVPLLYRLIPDSNSARTLGQFVVSTVCWLALATVVARCLHRVRLVGFFLVLAFSLSVWITQWDSVILSESVAVSLCALMLAAWLALVRAPRGATITAVLGITFLWTFTRDPNALVVLCVVPCVIVWGLRSSRWHGALALACGLALVASLSVASASVATDPWARWQLPLLNVIGTRVLTDSSELQYFRAHGMPFPAALQTAGGDPLGIDLLRKGGPLRSDPRIVRFLHWTWANGRLTLATFLLTHPYRALAPIAQDADQLLDPKALVGYRASGTRPVLPAAAGDWLYPPSPVGILVWLGLVAVGAGFFALRGVATRFWVVAAVSLVIELPHAALVLNGDGVELTRHALLVGIMTRLSLLLLTVFLLDAGAGLVKRGDWSPRLRLRAG